jgi:hypothetical protein
LAPGRDRRGEPPVGALASIARQGRQDVMVFIGELDASALYLQGRVCIAI